MTGLDAPPSEIDLKKRKLRSEMRVKRGEIGADDRVRAARALVDCGLPLIQSFNVKKIAAYYPMAEEFDTRPLLSVLEDKCFTLAMPVVVKPHQPLSFRRWHSGDQMKISSFGVREPGPERVPLVPELLLVPLLAFDRSGYRLGYGGGYYDRSLAQLRGVGTAIAVGVAFDIQAVETVPHDRHDQKLDAVVTESGVFQLNEAD